MEASEAAGCGSGVAAEAGAFSQSGMRQGVEVCALHVEKQSSRAHCCCAGDL